MILVVNETTNYSRGWRKWWKWRLRSIAILKLLIVIGWFPTQVIKIKEWGALSHWKLKERWFPLTFLLQVGEVNHRVGLILSHEKSQETQDGKKILFFCFSIHSSISFFINSIFLFSIRSLQKFALADRKCGCILNQPTTWHVLRTILLIYYTWTINFSL